MTKRASTVSKPSFSLDEGMGFEFLVWLGTSCGGGKNKRESRQIGKREMKYFMQALGNNADDIELINEFVDCCLPSTSIFISFLKTLDEEWKIGPSGALNYVKTISEFIDFRNASGITDKHFKILYCCRSLSSTKKQRRIFEQKRTSSLTPILTWRL